MTGNAHESPAVPGPNPDTEVRRERRLIYRLVREWLSVRRLRSLPSINDLNPRTFSIDWHLCALVHLGDEAGQAVGRASFEFVGSGFLDEVPGCAIGTLISAVPDSTRLACTVSPLCRLIEIRAFEPVAALGSIRKSKNTVLKFRTVALPFADHSGLPHYGLGAFSGTVSTVVLPDFCSKRAHDVIFRRFDAASNNWIDM